MAVLPRSNDGRQIVLNPILRFAIMSGVGGSFLENRDTGYSSDCWKAIRISLAASPGQASKAYMVRSKIHAWLGVSAAAMVLACTMSVVLVRSGGFTLKPAIRVDGDDTVMATRQPLVPTDAVSRAGEFRPGPMLVATPMPDGWVR